MTTFRLEPLGTRHVDSIQRLVENDRDILAHTRMPDPYPPDGARQFVARMDGVNEHAWAIVLETGELAGACGVKFHDDRAEIGYWIGAPFRARGLATAAARHAALAARDRFGFSKVVAETRAANTGSRRVLEKVGFELVRIRPNGDREPKWPADEPMADYRLAPCDE